MMAATQKNSFSANTPAILQGDRLQALRTLIKLSEKLIDISEKESQALVKNDTAMFAVLQDEKESASAIYAQAAHEFHERLNEFRGADKNLIDRLELLQRQLGQMTRSNSEHISRMYEDAFKNVNEGLTNANDMDCLATFPKTTATDETLN